MTLREAIKQLVTYHKIWQANDYEPLEPMHRLASRVFAVLEKLDEPPWNVHNYSFRFRVDGTVYALTRYGCFRRDVPTLDGGMEIPEEE